MLTHLSVYRAALGTHRPDVKQAASFTCAVKSIVHRLMTFAAIKAN